MSSKISEPSRVCFRALRFSSCSGERDIGSRLYHTVTSRQVLSSIAHPPIKGYNKFDNKIYVQKGKKLAKTMLIQY